MITEIDWRYWRVMPEVTQWEACALSLNINPEKMRHHPDAWMNGPGAPIFTNAGFRSAEISEEFKKRRRLLEASVFTSGFFPTVRGLVMGARWKATIRLDEFATWMAHVGLDMPPELCALHEPASKPHATPASEPVTLASSPISPPPKNEAQAGLAKIGDIPPLENWKMKVQAEATQMIVRGRTHGAQPVVHSILDDLVRWCRENGVKTQDGEGVFPSAGYLRTHVLSSKHWTPPKMGTEQTAQAAQTAHVKIAQAEHK